MAQAFGVSSAGAQSLSSLLGGGLSALASLAAPGGPAIATQTLADPAGPSTATETLADPSSPPTATGTSADPTSPRTATATSADPAPANGARAGRHHHFGGADNAMQVLAGDASSALSATASIAAGLLASV